LSLTQTLMAAELLIHFFSLILVRCTVELNRNTLTPAAAAAAAALPHQVLSRDREVIIFDNPGIGNSTLPGDVDTAGLTIPGMAQSTVNFLGALGLDQSADVIGWSMGGFIALTMAARHGSFINNVVIVASRASGPELTVSPSTDQLSNSNASMFDLLTEGSFPQGGRDPGGSEGLYQGCTNEGFWHQGYTNKDFWPQVLAVCQCDASPSSVKRSLFIDTGCNQTAQMACSASCLVLK
jgi:pimeloyl-ACP methyl ester carboxylesterase